MHKLICIILTAILIHSAQALIYEEAAPVIWQETGKVVDYGLTHYAAIIEFTDPCEAIDKYERNFHLRSRLATTEFKDLKVWCSAHFKDSISNMFKSFLHDWSTLKRSKRSLKLQRNKRFVLGFITGYFLTNVLTTVKEYVHPSHPDLNQAFSIENVHQLDQKLRSINDVLNLTSSVLQSQSRAIDQIHKDFKAIDSVVKEMGPIYTTLVRATNALSIEFEEHKDLIRRLSKSFAHDSVDIDALEDLTDNEWLKGADARTARPIDVRQLGATKYVIEFRSNKKAPDCSIYRVDSIRVWTNLTSTPTLMQYTGPRYIMHNRTSSCTRPVDDPIQNSIVIQCPWHNYKEASLSDWTAVRKVDHLGQIDTPTFYKEKWPMTYVYCYGRQINIGPNSIECPHHPFRLAINTAWNTSDYTYRPSFITVNSTISYHDIDQDLIRSIHVPAAVETRTQDTIKKVHELVQELEKAQNKSTDKILEPLYNGYNYIYERSYYFVILFCSIVILVLYLNNKWRNFVESMRQHQGGQQNRRATRSAHFQSILNK